MGKKKEKVTLNQVLPQIQCINEEVVDIDNTYDLEGNSSYVLIKHPLIKNKLIYIKTFHLFRLNGIYVSLKSLIKERKIVDKDVVDKINDLVLIIKLVDAYNGIDKQYQCIVKNKKLYIL